MSYDAVAPSSPALTATALLNFLRSTDAVLAFLTKKKSAASGVTVSALLSARGALLSEKTKGQAMALLEHLSANGHFYSVAENGLVTIDHEGDSVSSEKGRKSRVARFLKLAKDTGTMGGTELESAGNDGVAPHDGASDDGVLCNDENNDDSANDGTNNNDGEEKVVKKVKAAADQPKKKASEQSSQSESGSVTKKSPLMDKLSEQQVAPPKKKIKGKAKKDQGGRKEGEEDREEEDTTEKLKKKSKTEKKVRRESYDGDAAKPDFIKSRNFAGRKSGMVFKKGSAGVGYYTDVFPPHAGGEDDGAFCIDEYNNDTANGGTNNDDGGEAAKPDLTASCSLALQNFIDTLPAAAPKVTRIVQPTTKEYVSSKDKDKIREILERLVHARMAFLLSCRRNIA